MLVKFNSVNTQFNSRIRKIPNHFFPVIFLLICGWLFSQLHSTYENDFRPQGVHSWAQSDRFSIARNYYDNGLNFFVPQTNYLEYSEGKTGVELPAIQYIAAVIAKPFGARDQLFLIYRILCFVFFSISGLSLLFIVKLHGGNAFQQLLIPLFYLCSPVLLFYGFNFLPDIPSLAFIVLSYYHFEKHRLKIAYHSIYYAIIIGCFAAALKLTSAIFPMAYLVWYLVNALIIEKQITKNQISKVVVVFVVGFTCLFLCTYFFSIRANQIYKSGVFLSKSRHINDWGNFKEIWSALVCWNREYFREGHYWLMAFAFIVSINPRFKQKDVLIFKGILFLGMLCFLFLMGKQLIDHDYYAICTIVPALIIFSLDGLMILTTGCFGAIALFFIVQHITPLSLNQVSQRNTELYQLKCMDIYDSKDYMKESAQWFENKSIKKSAIVFVLYDYPLNTPLVYLDKKGMVINREKMRDLKLVDKWFKINNPNYIVIPINFKDSFLKDRPDIAEKCTLVYLGKSTLIYNFN